MAIQGVTGTVNIPLMERALAGSKNLARQTSGMSDIRIEARVNRSRAEGMNKAAATLQATKAQKNTVARISGQTGRVDSAVRGVSILA